MVFYVFSSKCWWKSNHEIVRSWFDDNKQGLEIPLLWGVLKVSKDWCYLILFDFL